MNAPSDTNVLRRARTAGAIKTAASELLAATDPRRVTVSEIAQQASVSVGAIYFHFGSKDGLYLELLEEALDLSARYTLNRRWSESPLQRVFNVGEAYVNFALENPEAFRLITQRIPVNNDDPELGRAQARIEKRIATEVTSIEKDLVDAIAAGEIVALSPGRMITYLWASWAGVIGMAFREDAFRISPDEVNVLLRGAGAILARGIRPEPD